MLKRLKNLVTAVALMLLLLPADLLAQESQVYFVARKAPQGSITSAGQAQQVVYLRWDALEGRLPDSIDRLRLERTVDAGTPDAATTILGEWPVDAVRSTAAIAELYTGPEQLRRKLETITRLNELASNSGVAFSASQFADRIRKLIDPANKAADGASEKEKLWSYNPLWAYLGSRTDFNIARARYRGFVDASPGTGMVQYELLAIDTDNNNETARLGLVELNVSLAQTPLGATGLRQVRISDTRCDLPESAKDHYTVMLDWESPGAGVASDRIAAQSYIAGFDLYRSTENIVGDVWNAPAVDIAALAAGAGHDSRGRPQLTGLEQVNVSLIIDPGRDAVDQDWLLAKQALEQELSAALPSVPPERIPTAPRWVEARDLLARAGLKPGDRRYYYLVPRDFTGNYGPTVGAVVEVPNMTRPPAPWNLRDFADQTNPPESMAIRWDEVRLDTYMNMYQGSRLFCNQYEAASSNILEYVPLGRSCSGDLRNAVRMDVSNYRIYRFTDFDKAGRFKDSDGDGVADSDEVVDLNGDNLRDAYERSLGTQCDAGVKPADAVNYLIWPKAGSACPQQVDPDCPPDVELVVESDFNPNKFAVWMRDQVPAGANKDAVFWYRVVAEATRASNEQVGRLSNMSAPQRALFPDREPPDPPVVSVTGPGIVPKGCAFEVVQGGEWTFNEEVQDDPATQSFTINGCPAGSFSVSTSDLQGCKPFFNSQCDQPSASPVLTFSGSDATGGACQAAIPADFCQSGTATLVPTYGQGDVDLNPGELVLGGPEIMVLPPDDPDGGRICIALYESIDGTASRVGSTCDPGGLVWRPGSGQFCGYAVATDENNNVSRTVQIPCTISPSSVKAPSPPQILEFTVDDQQARFTFRLPAEQVAVALARLDHEPGDGGSNRSIETISVIDNEPGVSISYALPVEALQAPRDRFCLSMLSLGRDPGNGKSLSSDWSVQRCFTRSPDGEDLPDYMPWPRVQGASFDPRPLQAGLVSGYRALPPFLAIKLLEEDGLMENCQSLQPGQSNPSTPSTIPENQMRDFDLFACLDPGISKLRSVLIPQLNFLVYRQSRINGGAPSDWIQVSPLIDYAHFDRRVEQISDRDIAVWTLNDPFIRTMLFNPVGIGGGRLSVLFLDNYPYVVAADLLGTQLYEWRYQVVYFDQQHRPVKWRASDWFREVD